MCCSVGPCPLAGDVDHVMGSLIQIAALLTARIMSEYYVRHVHLFVSKGYGENGKKRVETHTAVAVIVPHLHGQVWPLQEFSLQYRIDCKRDSTPNAPFNVVLSVPVFITGLKSLALTCAFLQGRVFLTVWESVHYSC